MEPSPTQPKYYSINIVELVLPASFRVSIVGMNEASLFIIDKEVGSRWKAYVIFSDSFDLKEHNITPFADAHAIIPVTWQTNKKCYAHRSQEISMCIRTKQRSFIDTPHSLI